MPQNQAGAPLLAEGFPMIPSMQPRYARAGRSQRDKQTNMAPKYRRIYHANLVEEIEEMFSYKYKYESLDL